MTEAPGNYTDPDHTGNIPLRQPWEAIATRELSYILNYLVQGLFFNPEDFAERLRQAADMITDPMMGLVTEAERFPLFHPQPEYQIDPGVVAQVIGVHVNAVAIAAKQLGISTAQLMQAGKAQLETQSETELAQICMEALQ